MHGEGHIMRTANVLEVTTTSQAAKEMPALASPYEIASIAIALASLRANTEPDIEGAIMLLRLAAMRGQNEKRPFVQYPDALLVDDPVVAKLNQEVFARVGAGTIIQTPDTHPEAARCAIERIRQFKGADTIVPPAAFPASSLACWRAILRRSPRHDELQRKKAAVLKLNPGAAEIVDLGAATELGFWAWAGGIFPFLPRRGQITRKAKTKRSKQSGTAGQFTRPSKGTDGRFKKK